MKNIAYQKAISLLKNNTLPFFEGTESDFLIARNAAIREINLNRVTVGMFDIQFWDDVMKEMLKINYEKFLLLNK